MMWAWSMLATIVLHIISHFWLWGWQQRLVLVAFNVVPRPTGPRSILIFVFLVTPDITILFLFGNFSSHPSYKHNLFATNMIYILIIPAPSL